MIQHLTRFVTETQRIFISLNINAYCVGGRFRQGGPCGPSADGNDESPILGVGPDSDWLGRGILGQALGVMDPRRYAMCTSPPAIPHPC